MFLSFFIFLFFYFRIIIIIFSRSYFLSFHADELIVVKAEKSAESARSTDEIPGNIYIIQTYTYIIRFFFALECGSPPCFTDILSVLEQTRSKKKRLLVCVVGPQIEL